MKIVVIGAGMGGMSAAAVKIWLNKRKESVKSCFICDFFLLNNR